MQRTYRRTTLPLVLAGVPLPVNANLIVLLGAANRDPSQLPDGDYFDIQHGYGMVAGAVGLGGKLHCTVAGVPVSGIGIGT